MSHGHGHGHASDEYDVVVDPRWLAWLWPVVIGLGVVVVIAMAVLWPLGDDETVDDPLLLDADPVAADVVDDRLITCSSGVGDCRWIEFEMTDGPYEGESASIELPADSRVREGDAILLTVFETEAGRLVFDFYDFQRSTALWVLVALFAVAVIALGRWRGVGALAGLAVSLFVIVVFALPAILDGTDAVLIAVVAAAAIAYVALFLAHGFHPSTAIALLATLASLLITVVLAQLFVGFTNLTGLSDDNSLLLFGLGEGVDARGILLAGIVIGSLGVLDDVTVTQVSAVWQLKSVQRELPTRELAGRAMRIGRDHISSTVNTLFLAYAGTALPLLLLFTSAQQSVGSVLTRELVAVEIVRTLVGSIGLVASVPIATWLAALAVSSTADAAPVEGDPTVGLDGDPVADPADDRV